MRSEGIIGAQRQSKKRVFQCETALFHLNYRNPELVVILHSSATYQEQNKLAFLT